MSNEQPPNAENLAPNSDSENAISPPANERPSGGWQMPKPVFKKTSGYLPQGFEKLVNTGQVPDAPTPEDVQPPDGFAPENVHVVAQPDISEHLLPDEEPPVQAAAAPKKQKSMARRVVLGLFFLLLMAAFATGFLYIIITLFFSS